MKKMFLVYHDKGEILCVSGFPNEDYDDIKCTVSEFPRDDVIGFIDGTMDVSRYGVESDEDGNLAIVELVDDVVANSDKVDVYRFDSPIAKYIGEEEYLYGAPLNRGLVNVEHGTGGIVHFVIEGGNLTIKINNGWKDKNPEFFSELERISEEEGLHSLPLYFIGGFMLPCRSEIIDVSELFTEDGVVITAVEDDAKFMTRDVFPSYTIEVK